MRKAKIALVSLTLVAVAVVWYSIYAQNVFYEWTLFFGSFIEDSIVGMLAFMLFATLSAMLSPFSSIPIVPVALVIWGPFTTSMLLLAGWLLGGVLAYAIGRKWGYALVSSFIHHEKIDKWSRQIERKVSIFLVLAFRIMTPSETGYIFGILKYPLFNFALITLLSELPFAFAISYGGSAILAKEQQIFWLLAIASATFLALVYQAYRREFRKVAVEK